MLLGINYMAQLEKLMLNTSDYLTSMSGIQKRKTLKDKKERQD